MNTEHMGDFVVRTTAAMIAVLWVTCSMAQTPAIAVPTIKGPIPVTAQSGEPFRGANEQPVPGPGLPLPVLQPYGYIEEEYFISGTVDGKPYTTSLLVRKPKDASKFSGLVAVETVHAAGAIPFWGVRDVWLNGGHGWAAVASQRVALEGQVKKFNAARYANLTIPEVEAAASTPQQMMSGGAQDLYSQAIMTQVGEFLKSNTKDSPFAGLQVKFLVMGGASQTGGTTLRYIENSHAKARMPDGKPIYDGYLPGEAFSRSPLPPTDAAIIHTVTEGDLANALAGKRTPPSRPDSDAPNDRYRHYQIAGASHVGTRGITDPKAVFSTLENAVKPGEQLSQFPNEVYVSTAFHLADWVLKGAAPPKASPIEVVNGEIVRDEQGNAKGGLRSPYVDTPTVRYIAAAPADTANPMRRLIGFQEPLSKEKLASLYKSRDNYLRRFNEGIDKMVTQRWLRPNYAEKLKTEEAKLAPQF
jgi:hypothetical protein